MNPAVLSAISYVIRRCKKNNVETSICGQAASKPEMAEFLVKEGIDSISVNADAAYEISKLISSIEKDGKRGESNSSRRESGESNSSFRDAISSPITAIKRLFGSDDQKKESVVAGKKGQDMEEIILEQLGDDNNSIGNSNGDGNGNEDDPYSPGSHNDSSNIPLLNDAIPVESELFDEHKNNK
jgi:hypothetical protein